METAAPLHAGNGMPTATRLHFAQREAREENTTIISTSTTSPPPPPPLLQVMKYEVPLLLNLLPLKYQGKTENIFQENPAPLWCLIAATSSYWLIVGIMKEKATLNLSCEWIQALRFIAFASALISWISLLGMFSPHVALAIVLTSLVSLVLLYAFTLLIKRGRRDNFPPEDAVSPNARGGREGNVFSNEAMLSSEDEVGNVSTEEAMLPSSGGEGDNDLMVEISLQV